MDTKIFNIIPGSGEVTGQPALTAFFAMSPLPKKSEPQAADSRGSPVCLLLIYNRVVG